MADWMVWLSLAGGLVVLEMFSGTFYLLMLGIGMAAGGVAAFAGGARATQFITAAVVGIVATYALRRSKWGLLNRGDAGRNPDVNLDIGQTVAVDAWSGVDDQPRTARVMYRGALWDVELQEGSAPRTGTFVICEVKGNRLIVTSSRTI